MYGFSFEKKKKKKLRKVGTYGNICFIGHFKTNFKYIDMRLLYF